MKLDPDPYVRALQLIVWITILVCLGIIIGGVIAQIVNG